MTGQGLGGGVRERERERSGSAPFNHISLSIGVENEKMSSIEQGRVRTTDPGEFNGQGMKASVPSWRIGE